MFRLGVFGFSSPWFGAGDTRGGEGKGYGTEEMKGLMSQIPVFPGTREPGKG